MHELKAQVCLIKNEVLSLKSKVLDIETKLSILESQMTEPTNISSLFEDITRTPEHKISEDQFL